MDELRVAQDKMKKLEQIALTMPMSTENPNANPMRKGCLAIRWGAFGDMYYALPALEALKKKFGYLHLETTTRGMEVFQYNKTFDRISAVNLSEWASPEWEKVAQLRWGLLTSIEWERTVNFWRCLEVAAIPEEHQLEWHWERERRQEKYGKLNFYDEHFRRAGLEIPARSDFDCGTMYFENDQAEWMRYFRHKFADAFVVAMPLSGSTGQKVPQMMEKIALMIKKEVPSAVFVQLGWTEDIHLQFSFGENNCVHTCGNYPYLQSAALTKIADYAVGPETSLMVAAGLFGTPKTMLATASGVDQACYYHKNDFSTQSLAPCAPCHRAIYDQRICNIKTGDWGSLPACNFDFDLDKIMEGVRFAVSMRQLRREVERLDGVAFGSLPDLRALDGRYTNGPGDLRQTILAGVRPEGGNGSRASNKRGALVPCSEVYLERGKGP